MYTMTKPLFKIKRQLFFLIKKLKDNMKEKLIIKIIIDVNNKIFMQLKRNLIVIQHII